MGGVNRYWYGKIPAEVVLRWQLDHNISAIPKSVRPERIAENINIFDFELTADEIAAIDGLDTGVRGGPDPEIVDGNLYKVSSITRNSCIHNTRRRRFR